LKSPQLCILKAINLPRQARDKDREDSKTDPFSQVALGGFLSIVFSFMVGDLNYMQEETLLPSIVGTISAVVAASCAVVRADTRPLLSQCEELPFTKPGSGQALDSCSKQ
jgi:hypothetical protein